MVVIFPKKKCKSNSDSVGRSWVEYTQAFNVNNPQIHPYLILLNASFNFKVATIVILLVLHIFLILGEPPIPGNFAKYMTKSCTTIVARI